MKFFNKLSKHRHLNNIKNTYLLTRKELLTIYDLIVDLSALIAKENDGFLDTQHNKIHKAICRLDDYYTNIMVDCDLLTIEEIEEDN